MLSRSGRALTLVAGLTTAAPVLTGCFLRNMLGKVIIVLQTVIGAVLGQAAPCNHTLYDYSSAPPPDPL